jgi:hypothetical protein
MAQAGKRVLIKSTADIRAKLLEIWRQLDDKEISLSEARVHIAAARAVLDSIKVEIAMAHLANTQIGPIALGSRNPALATLGPESRKQ